MVTANLYLDDEYMCSPVIHTLMKRKPYRITSIIALSD